jgi:hypothetical protein
VLLLALGSAAPRIAPAATPVAPEEAQQHAGQVVTVEGEVRSAHTVRDTIVLDLAGGLRVIVVVPLFGSVPRDPARAYEGRRVRVTGTVERFRGRSELVVKSPEQIELPEERASASAPAPTAPPASAPPPAAPAPAVASPTAVPGTPPAPSAAPPPAPAAPPATPPPVPPPAPAVQSAAPAAPPTTLPPPAVALRTEAAPCERAREQWRRTAADARERLVELTRCLDAARYHCEAERRAVAPALAALESSERDVAGVCP